MAEVVSQAMVVAQYPVVGIWPGQSELFVGLEVFLGSIQLSLREERVPKPELALREPEEPFNVRRIASAEFLGEPKRFSEEGNGLTRVALVQTYLTDLVQSL